MFGEGFVFGLLCVFCGVFVFEWSGWERLDIGEFLCFVICLFCFWGCGWEKDGGRGGVF